MPDSIPMMDQPKREYAADRHYPLTDRPCRYTEDVTQQQNPDHDQSPFK